ncbi:MAG TPA: hypothetical protein VGT42_05760 [Gammaproteobacteria bacterium]|nr:hypothetical protein [Gammaproteobacteria bacterium]
MTLSDYLASYYELSGKASDVARQLAFAGIAVIWVFHQGQGGAVAVPASLIGPAVLFIGGLACDLLQYVSGTLIWGAFHRVQEQRLGADSKKPLTAPAYFNWPSLFFFWSKLALILAGYLLLLHYLLSII